MDLRNPTLAVRGCLLAQLGDVRHLVLLRLLRSELGRPVGGSAGAARIPRDEALHVVFRLMHELDLRLDTTARVSLDLLATGKCLLYLAHLASLRELCLTHLLRVQLPVDPVLFREAILLRRCGGRGRAILLQRRLEG